MGLDIWFREDILHALKAAEQASATTAAAIEHALGSPSAGSGCNPSTGSGRQAEGAGDPRYLRAYREGYRAALITVATAFGIAQPDDTPGEFNMGEVELLAKRPAKSLKRQFSLSAF